MTKPLCCDILKERNYIMEKQSYPVSSELNFELTPQQIEQLLSEGSELARKIEEMSSEEYDEFIMTTTKKIKELDNKRLSILHKYNILNSKPRIRNKLSYAKFLPILIASGIIIGGTSYFVDLKEEIFSLTDSVRVHIGTFLGITLGAMGITAYENKSISNILNDIKKKILQKKYIPLSTQSLIQQYLLKTAQNAREDMVQNGPSTYSWDSDSKTVTSFNHDEHKPN